MAQSFAFPGTRECNVAEFDADKQQGWERFCDCMFIEQRPIVTLQCSNGAPFPPGTDPQAAQQHCINNGLMLQSAVVGYEPGAKTADWYKCVAKLCLLPTGCWNAYRGAGDAGKGWDPLNVHVGMLAAPWTDFGAAARGIPKRTPSAWYDVARATAIDLNDFTPVALWKLFWQNKGLFLVRIGQMQAAGIVFPLFGAAFNLSGFGTNPFMMVGALAAQVALERRDVLQDVVMPMLLGTWDDAQVAFKLLFLGGPFAAFQPFTVGGIFVAKFARDQISTGEAAKASPALQAVLHFLATAAERIGAEMQRTLTTANVSMNNVSSIMNIVKTGFQETAVQLPAGPTRDWVRGIVVVLGVAYEIVDGMEKGEQPDDIVDDVVFELFGFRLRGPGGLVESIRAGPAAVRVLFSSVASRGKATDLAGARVRLDTVGAAFNNLVQVLVDLGAKLGGGVQKFAQQFQQFLGLFNGIAQTTDRDTSAAMAASPVAPPPPVVVTPGTGRPPKGTSSTVPPPPPPKGPTVTAKPSIGAGAVVGASAGAAAGALVFGVGAAPGALIGGAAGALLALARGSTPVTAPKLSGLSGLSSTEQRLLGASGTVPAVPAGLLLPPLPGRWKPK